MSVDNILIVGKTLTKDRCYYYTYELPKSSFLIRPMLGLGDKENVLTMMVY